MGSVYHTIPYHTCGPILLHSVKLISRFRLVSCLCLCLGLFCSVLFCGGEIFCIIVSFRLVISLFSFYFYFYFYLLLFWFWFLVWFLVFGLGLGLGLVGAACWGYIRIRGV